MNFFSRDWFDWLFASLIAFLEVCLDYLYPKPHPTKVASSSSAAIIFLVSSSENAHATQPFSTSSENQHPWQPGDISSKETSYPGLPILGLGICIEDQGDSSRDFYIWLL